MSVGGGAKKKKGGHEEHEEHVNHERWLVTYADMLTLLMVLFIVMFAMSQVDQRKFALLKEGLAAGLGSPDHLVLAEETAPMDSGGAADSEVSALSPGAAPNLQNGLPNGNGQGSQ